jgi:hypothetical protein
VHRRNLAKAKAALQLFGLGARNRQADTDVVRDVDAPQPNDRIESLARSESSCKLRMVASEVDQSDRIRRLSADSNQIQ